MRIVKAQDKRMVETPSLMLREFRATLGEERCKQWCNLMREELLATLEKCRDELPDKEVTWFYLAHALHGVEPFQTKIYNFLSIAALSLDKESAPIRAISSQKKGDRP